MARTYQVVLGQIEDDLLAGRLAVGGRLPGERALAERYGVSRPSVREAIRVLEAMGLIRTGVGSGPDAGAVVIADATAPIGAALRWHLASRHLPVGDLVGARVMIETWAGRAAAERIAGGELKPDDLRVAADLLGAMAVDGAPEREFLDLDARFHVSIAELAGNSVVAAMMGALRAGIQAYVAEAVGGLADWPAMARRLCAEHAGILAAIAAGRPDDAAGALAAHIEGVYRDTGLGG